MKQLSGIDTAFLTSETPTTHLHVSALLTLDPRREDGSTVTVPEIRHVLEQRMRELPLSRRRLVEVPLQLDNPYWVEDHDFDADFHIRHMAVPSPGDGRALASLVEQLVAIPLDRRRPLWEVYLIEGYQGDEVAVLTKVHHSAVDGVGGIELLASILDLGPEPRPANHVEWDGEVPPTPGWLLARAARRAAERPWRLAAFQRNLLEVVATQNRRAIPLAPLLPALGNLGAAGAALFTSVVTPRRPTEELVGPPAGSVPRTVFQGQISSRRRFAYGTVGLAEIKQIRTAHPGTTVNDVVLALCAEVLRPWFVRRGTLPDEPLVAMVPVSIRSEDEAGEGGNLVSAMVAPIFTNIEDPSERLLAIHERMKVVKEDHAATPPTLVADVAEFATPAVASAAARGISSLGLATLVSPLANLTISNVPGPQVPLYGAGARVTGVWPCSALADTLGLNITVVSYDGRICFGVLGCREMLPDAWELVEELPAAVERLLAACPT